MAGGEFVLTILWCLAQGEEGAVDVAAEYVVVAQDAGHLVQAVLVGERRVVIDVRLPAQQAAQGLLRCPLCHRGLFGHREGEHHTYYQCRDSSPAKNAAGMVCNARRYPAGEAEETVLGMLRDAAREPGRLRAALRASREGDRAEATGDQLRRELAGVRGELATLDARERTAVQAQVAGLQAGASAGAYAAVFGEIAAERARLQSRLAALEALRPTAGHAAPEGEAERIEAVLADVDEALGAPELTPAERHGLLRRVVAEVYPEGDGYRLRLRAGEDEDSVRNVSMSPAREDDEAARQDRIMRWHDRLPPAAPWAPGDPRKWEREHAATAELTPLGRRLLGLDRWEDGPVRVG